MRAIQSLPQNYFLHKEIDLSRDFRLLLVLNLLAIPLLFFFSWFFQRLALLFRSDFQASGIRTSTLGSILGILISLIGVIILHELIHGVFFWVITGQRPHFGFKGAYAFAAAPTWYIARGPYLIIGLSPLVLISIAGVLLIPVVPLKILSPLAIAFTFNAAGAIGDAAIVAYLLTLSPKVLVNDRGDAVAIYVKEDF